MNSWIELSDRFGEAALGFAWPMLWQSSLLIAALFMLDFVLRRKVRAAVRYALWLVVLLKLLLPPSLAFPTGLAWWVRPLAPSPPVFQTKPFVVTYSSALMPLAENLPVFHPPPPPVRRLSAAPGRRVGQLRPSAASDCLLVASTTVAGQCPHPPPARRGCGRRGDGGAPRRSGNLRSDPARSRQTRFSSPAGEPRLGRYPGIEASASATD